MEYVVTCLTDEGERVRVTRKTFTSDEADHYMHGVAQSRKPMKHMLCTFCKVEWRTGYVEGGTPETDWPRCVNCHAC
jgi:hypothetical protein